MSILLYLSFIAKGLAIYQLVRVITTKKVLFYSLKLTVLNSFYQQLIPFNSIGTLRNLTRVTNQFLASLGVFGSSNPWQCKLKLKYMKNPSFGALHSPLPSLTIGCQANHRCKEENQRKKSNNQHFRMVVRNFAHHAKPQEAAKEFAHHAKFHMVCEIFLCTNSIRFLS